MKYLISILFACFFSSVFAQREIQYAGVVDGYIQDGYAYYPNWKVIDSKGQTLADSLGKFHNNTKPHVSEGMFECISADEKIGFKNHRNRLVIPHTYDETRGFINGIAAVRVNDKWGLIDKRGKLIADTVYAYVSNMEESGVAVLLKANQQLGCVNRSGKLIVPFSYQAIESKFIQEPIFNEGLLAVSSYRLPGEAYKIGFINSKGVLVIDTIYELDGAAIGDWRYNMSTARMCGTGMAALRETDTRYLKGDFYKFVAGKALVEKDGMPLVINTRGDSLFTIPVGYDKIENSNGYFLISKSQRTLFSTGGSDNSISVWTNGKMTIPKSYTEIIGPANGYFIVKTWEQSKRGMRTREEIDDTEYMFFDTLGNPSFSNLKFLDIVRNGFDHGTAVVYVKDKDNKPYPQILDRKGQLRSVKGAVMIRPGSDGTYAVWVREEHGELMKGLLDSNLKWILEPGYYNLYPFENGVAQVGKPGKSGENWGYINIKGNYIIQPLYPQITPLYTIKIK